MIASSMRKYLPPDVDVRVVSFPEALKIVGESKFPGRFPVSPDAWRKAMRDLANFIPWPWRGVAEELTWAYPVFEYLEKPLGNGQKVVYSGPRTGLEDVIVRKPTTDEHKQLVMIHAVLCFFRAEAPKHPGLFYRTVAPISRSDDADLPRVHAWARDGWIETAWEWTSVTLFDWYHMTWWVGACDVVERELKIACTLWVDREKLEGLLVPERPAKKRGRPYAITSADIAKVVGELRVGDFDRAVYSSLTDYLRQRFSCSPRTASNAAKKVEAALGRQFAESIVDEAPRSTRR